MNYTHEYHVQPVSYDRLIVVLEKIIIQLWFSYNSHHCYNHWQVTRLLDES